jgi:anti-anti-sigma factor
MFSIQQEYINDIKVLHLDGRIDTKATAHLQTEVDVIIAEDTNKLIVDCRQLSYVSSTGIRMFLILYRFFASKNKKMVLCGLNKVIDNVFDIAGLKEIFNIDSDCKNAIKNML